MSSLITDQIRSNEYEIYYGHEKCLEKSKFLLSEVGLPNGLLPLQDMIECGYVKETGFVWMKQKKKIEHRFEQVGKLVSYSELITAHIEPNRIMKLTGVKAKELLLWVTICEIRVEVPITGKIKFQTTTGFFRLFPYSAFELQKKKAVTDAKEEDQKKVGAGAAAAVEIKEV